MRKWDKGQRDGRLCENYSTEKGKTWISRINRVIARWDNGLYTGRRPQPNHPFS